MGQGRKRVRLAWVASFFVIGAALSTTASASAATRASTTTAPTTTVAPTTPTTGPPLPAVNDPFRPVSPPEAATTAHVSIVDFGFSPATITVSAGATVTWTNTGQSIHSVTSDASAFDSSPTCPTGSCINPGASYSHLFTAAGTFAYHCRVHANMVGTVVVNASTPGTTTPPTTSGGSGAGNPPVTAGGAGAGATTTTTATGPQLAFTGASSTEAWLVLGGLVTISVGFALRPRRRPFPIPVRNDPSDRH
jgi:plastocyanin